MRSFYYFLDDRTDSNHTMHMNRAKAKFYAVMFYDSGRLIPVFVRSPWHKTNNLYGFTHVIIMNYIKLNNYLAFPFLTKIYKE